MSRKFNELCAPIQKGAKFSVSRHLWWILAGPGDLDDQQQGNVWRQ